MKQNFIQVQKLTEFCIAIRGLWVSRHTRASQTDRDTEGEESNRYHNKVPHLVAFLDWNPGRKERDGKFNYKQILGLEKAICG